MRAEAGILSTLRRSSPVIVAAVAIGAHVGISNRQTSENSPAFLGLLMGFLAVSLMVAAMPVVWRRSQAFTSYYAPLLAGAIFLLAVWDLITLKLNVLPLPYFPGPDLVLRGMWDDRNLLAESTYHSLMLLACGYAMGVSAGLFSGVVIGWFRPVHYWAMPAIRVVGPIPATAFLPLVMTLLPDAFWSGTALIALAVWFPVTMLTASGIANVPVSYLDVARTLGAGRWFLIFRVAVPAAMPSIFLGLFMGLSASFLTLIIAETVGVQSGLGWYLKWQQGYLEYAKVYAALVVMALFFSGLMTLLFKVRDRVLGWQKGVISW